MLNQTHSVSHRLHQVTTLTHSSQMLPQTITGTVRNKGMSVKHFAEI